MLEHLSSLRRKSSEKAPSTNNENLTQNSSSCSEEKEVNDVYKVSGKSKNNIFKSLISDNGATNIFSNLLKCPEMHTNCTSVTSTVTSPAGTSSNSNGNVKQNNGNITIQNNHQQKPADDSNHRKSDHLNVQPYVIEHQNGTQQNMKKRNSVVKSNGEFILSSRELSPIPSRVHRKSCHDIRLMRNNQLVGENGDEVGKLAVVKPLKTRNIVTKNETLDMLYPDSINVSYKL